MAVTLVQSTSTNVGGGNNTTITLNGVTAGNLLVLSVWVWNGGNGSLTSVTDNKSQSWIGGKWQNNGPQGAANIYYVKQAQSGNTTVTVDTGNSGAYYSLVLQEFSCTAGSYLDIDQTSGAGAFNNSNNTAAAPALTSGATQERLFIACVHYNTQSATAPTISTPSGFTNVARNTNVSFECGSTEYEVATDNGANSASWGSTGNTISTDGWHAALASFKLVASGILATASLTGVGSLAGVAVREAVLFPDADLVSTGWINEATGTANLFASIDEASASWTDYVVSPGASANPFEFSVTNPPGAVGSTPVRVSYEIRRDGGTAMGATVQLRQGTTVIASWTHASLTETETRYDQVLSGAEQAAITDYNDLRLRVIPVP